jgi:hypothetical protein
VTAPGISQQLTEWAEQAGYTLTPQDHSGAALFWSDPGGEIRFYVRASSDGLTLTKSERAAPEQFELFARSLDVIERYLLGVFGWEIRARRRLPRLKTPRKLEDIADKYRIEDAGPDGVIRLLDERGEMIAMARGKVTGVAVLVELSHLLASPTEEIEISYKDVEGKPLFQT